jgi:hypothetical protein
MTLVMRGGKIDHPSGEHDDYANAAAGAVYLIAGDNAAFNIDDFQTFGDSAVLSWDGPFSGRSWEQPPSPWEDQSDGN